METLSSLAGFGVSLEGDSLLFPTDVVVAQTKSRTLEEMRGVLAGDARAAHADIYRVYRDIAPTASMQEWRDSMLRYDMTVMPAGAFILSGGIREFYRTVGHYHDTVQNGIGYPEIYEVLCGRAYWLIQKPSSDPSSIAENYLIEAGPGEKACVPPGFGHVMINAGPETLVTANIVATNFPAYDYSSFERLKGGSYRLLESDDRDVIEIEVNEQYSSVPPLKKLRIRRDWFKGYFEPLWRVMEKSRGDIRFLLEPEKYSSDFFAISRLFREII